MGAGPGQAADGLSGGQAEVAMSGRAPGLTSHSGRAARRPAEAVTDTDTSKRKRRCGAHRAESREAKQEVTESPDHFTSLHFTSLHFTS